jgi:hypothetical protein
MCVCVCKVHIFKTFTTTDRKFLSPCYIMKIDVEVGNGIFLYFYKLFYIYCPYERFLALWRKPLNRPVAFLCVLRLQVAAKGAVTGLCHRIRGCCAISVLVGRMPAYKPTERAGKTEELWEVGVGAREIGNTKTIFWLPSV